MRIFILVIMFFVIEVHAMEYLTLSPMTKEAKNRGISGMQKVHQDKNSDIYISFYEKTIPYFVSSIDDRTFYITKTLLDRLRHFTIEFITPVGTKTVVIDRFSRADDFIIPLNVLVVCIKNMSGKIVGDSCTAVRQGYFKSNKKGWDEMISKEDIIDINPGSVFVLPLDSHFDDKNNKSKNPNTWNGEFYRLRSTYNSSPQNVAKYGDFYVLPLGYDVNLGPFDLEYISQVRLKDDVKPRAYPYEKMLNLPHKLTKGYHEGYDIKCFNGQVHNYKNDFRHEYDPFYRKETLWIKNNLYEIESEYWNKEGLEKNLGVIFYRYGTFLDHVGKVSFIKDRESKYRAVGEIPLGSSDSRLGYINDLTLQNSIQFNIVKNCEPVKRDIKKPEKNKVYKRTITHTITKWNKQDIVLSYQDPNYGKSLIGSIRVKDPFREIKHNTQTTKIVTLKDENNNFVDQNIDIYLKMFCPGENEYGIMSAESRKCDENHPKGEILSIDFSHNTKQNQPDYLKGSFLLKRIGEPEMRGETYDYLFNVEIDNRIKDKRVGPNSGNTLKNNF